MPDSREVKLMAVEPGVVTPKLYVPSDVTYEVTSNVTQLPEVNAPDVAMVLSIAGAFEYVIVLSPQPLSATVQACMPALELLFI